MKLLPAILCLAIIALVTPACATKKQDTASCCAAKGDTMKGSCDAHMKKHKH
ncbi:MAG: hypothetical protein WCF18_22475 [Chthoniobacteraceae bacterium]